MIRAKRFKIRKMVISGISNFFKIIAVLTFAFPFYWMIITSLKTYAESIKFPPTFWPEAISLEGYIKVFTEIDVWPYVKNTLIILFGIMVISTVIMVPTAYVFARYEFKGKAFLFSIVTMTFMIPGQVTFITKYLMFSSWGILDTLLPQILVSLVNAFGIFMLRQTFMQVPEELVEAAQLDEASELQIITKIMLPMAKSTFSMVTILQVIGTWNAYFPASVYTISEKTQPITMLMTKFRNLEAGGMPWPTIMAGNMILIVPILLLFLVASKKILSAVAYRGAK